MLLNVGAAEALKSYDFQCFIFHDVDLLPEDDRNLYTCPVQPRHMSVAINTFLYRLPYNEIFGGVSAMTVDQFRQVNGFSNMFWGWGGEDDDMSNRLRQKKLYISRYPANIASKFICQIVCCILILASKFKHVLGLGRAAKTMICKTS